MVRKKGKLAILAATLILALASGTSCAWADTQGAPAENENDSIMHAESASTDYCCVIDRGSSDAYFTTLPAAIKAAKKGEEITLIDDIPAPSSTTEATPSVSNVYVNMNGCTIWSNGNAHYIFGNNITFINGTFANKKSGYPGLTSSKNLILGADVTGDLSVTGGTLKAYSDGGTTTLDLPDGYYGRFADVSGRICCSGGTIIMYGCETYKLFDFSGSGGTIRLYDFWYYGGKAFVTSSSDMSNNTLIFYSGVSEVDPSAYLASDAVGRYSRYSERYEVVQVSDAEARAVLKGLITDSETIRTQVDKLLKAGNDDIAEQFDDIQAAIDCIYGIKGEAVETNPKKYNTAKLATIEKNIQALENEIVAKIEPALRSATTETLATASDIEQAAEKLSTLKSAADTLKSLSITPGEMSDSLAALDTMFAQKEQEIANAAAAYMDKEALNTSEDIARLKTLLTSAEESASRTNEAYATLQGELTEAQDKIDQLQKKIDTFTGTEDGFNIATFESLKAVLNDLNSQVETLQKNALVQIEDEVNALKRDTTQDSDELMQIQNELTEIKLEDVAVKVSAAASYDKIDLAWTAKHVSDLDLAYNVYASRNGSGYVLVSEAQADKNYTMAAKTGDSFTFYVVPTTTVGAAEVDSETSSANSIRTLLGEKSNAVKANASLSAGTLKSVKPGKQKVTAAAGSVKGATGYQFSIKKTGSSWKTKSTTSKSMTFTKLKASTKYQVKVRPYTKVGSKTVYGKWSSSKTTKTK